MKVLKPGHQYLADNFEDKQSGQHINFIEKTLTEPNTTPQGVVGGELVTVKDGTTNEELLEILIDRLNYLNNKFPCRENAVAITHIETALLWLNKRTNDRLKRGVEGRHAA